MREEGRKIDGELTVWVFHGHNLLVCIQVVQEGREYPPRSIELVVTHKVRVVALQCVEDESLVGLGDLEVAEATAVGEVELGDGRLHAQAGELGVHLDVDGFVGLDADDELVAGNVFEYAGGDVLELDADFGLLLVEGCVR